MSANIARHLTEMAESQPGRAAIKVPRGRGADGSIDYLSLDFQALAEEASAWTEKLRAAGVNPGDRILVMVRPGLPLISSIFGIFQLGAVPVVIDPGMGLKSFLGCVARSRPKALLGIPAARLVSHVFRRPFRTVTTRIAAASSPVARLRQGPAPAPRAPAYDARVSDLAAILFTSGSTGAPKGVRYEHGMLAAQVEAVRTTYGIVPGEIDFPLLPVFALFNPALGMTTIVPELDPRRPAAIDAAAAVRAIQQENVTNSFGSPTLWKRIAEHCVQHRIQLESLKRVLCAGAPVPASLWASARQWLPNGVLQSPYGATEALPVSNVAEREIDIRSVSGACVGRPVRGVSVEILERNADGVGEIAVCGPMVTREYDNLPEATAAAKIPASALPPPPSDRPMTSGFYHRMGDCGRIDAEGRIWFLGRKAERVESRDGPLHTEPCEQVFRRHPRVRRCALIGLGARPAQTPAMVVETDAGTDADKQQIAAELADIGQGFPHTAAIEDFYFHPSFPVDVRHNAKIHRLALARWAAGAKSYKVQRRPRQG